MISGEDRKKKKMRVHDVGYFIQTLKEASQSVFKKVKVEEMLEEIEEIIFNETRCVFVIDDRKNTESNYIAIFITDCGGFAAIPCFVDEEAITMFNVKNILKDDYPNWYISRYQEIGKTRTLSALCFSYQGGIPKDLKSTLTNI